MSTSKLWTCLSVFGILGFILLVLGVVNGQEDTKVTLTTADGEAEVVGNRRILTNVRSRRDYFYAFEGIEYATAERWKEPKLKELKGEVQATQLGTSCSQWSPTGQRPIGLEECLYLNVYTPEFPGSRPGSQQYPVMLFIHPGGFMYGSGEKAGPRKLLRRDVILVTINYRLGVFGYLSTGDEHIPGNFGMLDQVVALEWIHKHIKSFGGNGQVTVFGNSAGSASTHLLMLSPRAAGLFDRAILQSGSAICDWSTESNPLEYANSIGEVVGCSGNSAELAKCLMGKDRDELISAQQGMLKLWSFPLRTAPVVDKSWRGEQAFLPEEPIKLMDEGNFMQIPVMAGVTHDEGLMGYADIHLAVGNDKFKNNEYFHNELIPDILNAMLDNDEETEVVADAVKTQYFEGIDMENGDQNQMKRAISELVELIGDITIYSCHWDLLEKLVKKSNSSVYSYVFTHKTPESPNIMRKPIQSLREMHVQHPLFDYGVSHCEDLFYLFEPLNLLPGNLNEKFRPVDNNVSEKMTELFVNFATNGNPGTGWRPVREGTINYYNITSIPAPMGRDFRKGEAIFWTQLIPYIRGLGANISELEAFSTLFWIFLGLFIFFLFLTLILACILWKKRSSKAVNL